MTRERARLEQMRRWKQVAVWAPVVWFPLIVYGLSVGRTAAALTLGLAGMIFAGLARAVVWFGHCPRCDVPYRERPGGFRRIWDEASCAACGVSLFELRRKAR